MSRTLESNIKIYTLAYGQQRPYGPHIRHYEIEFVQFLSHTGEVNSKFNAGDYEITKALKLVAHDGISFGRNEKDPFATYVEFAKINENGNVEIKLVTPWND